MAEQVKRPPGKGRGRGLLALTSFDPVPRPSKALAESHLKNPSAAKSNQTPVAQVNGHSQTNGQLPMQQQVHKNNSQMNGNSQKTVMSKDIRSNVSSKQINAVVHSGNTEGTQVMAKYNFTSNPNQPGGFKELTIKQGEHLALLQKGHLESKNPLWWEVKNTNGEVGYVPGNYCMVLDNKPTDLPWLENKRLEEEKKVVEEKKQSEKAINNSMFGVPETSSPSKPVVKAYSSAYSGSSGSGSNRNFYCEVCDKQLNGPTPYSMHMASKLHREEVEYLKSSS